jgi:Tol biopolymer transport system component
MSPDGSALVYAAVRPEGTSVRVRHEDGTELQVAERGFWPRWSPDGRWIAYTTSDPEGGDGTLHVVHPDGSGHRELTLTASQVYGLCWTPASGHVIFASQQAGPSALWAVDVETGEQVAVTRGPGSSSCPTLSADGRRLVFDFDHRRWYLYMAAEPGKPLSRVLVESGMVGAALSPDGTRIAMALGAEAQSPAVVIFDLETGERRTLTGMTTSAVAWWPDGRHLLLAARAPDRVSNWIWMLPAAGGLPEPLLKGDKPWEAPTASPDGSMVAAVRHFGAGSELVVHNLETGDQRVLVRKAAIETPRWSPDGRLLAWSGAWRPDDLTSGGIWMCAVDPCVPQRLVADGARPVWQADSESLLFLRFLEHEGVWRISTAAGPASLVHELQGETRQLSLEGLDLGRQDTPLLLFFYRFTGAVYALESPELDRGHR